MILSQVRCPKSASVQCVAPTLALASPDPPTLAHRARCMRVRLAALAACMPSRRPARPCRGRPYARFSQRRLHCESDPLPS